MRGAVKVLAENGWIGARELGTLERTSKNASAAVCNQDVWEALCLRVWPNTEKLTEEIDKMGGYRAWYRLRTTTTRAVVRKRGKDEPLPPSTIKASDLSFLFEIKMAGKAIISRRISGKQLGIGQKESYLEKGGGMIRSGKSFESFGWVLGETKQILDADNFRTEPFTVEVQMLTPERLCQLSIGSRRYIFNKDCVKSAVEDSDKFIYPGRVTQAERLQELRIRPSIIGSNVERRLKKGLAFRAFPVAYLVEDGKRVVVGGLCAQVLVRSNHVSSDWNLLNQEVKNTAGVSLLHIFEHLEDTSLTPSGLPKVTGGHLSYMPDKVLTLIFQYVAQRPHELLPVERVCKSMRQLLLNDEIWAAIPFTEPHNCDQIYRLNHLTIREKDFYAEGVRAIRYHQEQTDNIMLSILGGGANGFRSLCQTLLNKLRRDSNYLPRVHVRGDTVGYLAEMLQQWMVTKLESAREHRFKDRNTPGSYPVVITKSDFLGMDVMCLNCGVPDGHHPCNCNMISDDWKWPVDHCSGDDVMKSNDRRKIIRRLAYRASVVNMTAETFDVLSTELLHQMGCLLADAYSISKHSIGYFPWKSYRGEIDMFNCAPPCTEPKSLVTIVPGQIRKAAERRGITTFHVYGDTWIASSGSTVDQERAEAEALYLLDDGDGKISEPGKAGYTALEAAPSDVGKEDSSNVACIDAEDKTMDSAAEEDTNGYVPVPSDDESSDYELDMQDFVDEWSSDYEP